MLGKKSIEIGRLLLTLILMLSPCSSPLAAQTTKATILGVVVDEKGLVIPDAKVIARNLEIGTSRATATDGQGRYRLAELPVGSYEVAVEKSGFRLRVQRGIELTVGREAVVDMVLNVGDIQEKMVLEQDAPLIESTTSAIDYLVTQKQIERLPLNGRDVLQLATLQSGVTSTSAITFGQSEVGAGATRLSINGGRIDFNAYYLDGVETGDAFGYSPGGLGGGFLGVEALREFQVLTSNYSAEFGQGGGGIINAVTRSGSNQFHATVFEFLRNSALDARNSFDDSPNQLPFKRNQFGGNLGGPLVRDRAFLFGNYEGLRRREGVPSLFNVPSPDARQGLLVDPAAVGADPNDPSRKRRITVAQSVLPYLALYPRPNGPISGDTGLFRRNFNETTDEDFFTLRADYRLFNHHSLVGRYTLDNSSLTKAGGVIQNLELRNRNQYVALEEQALVGARGVNSLRFTYNRSNFSNDFPFTVPVGSNLAFVPGHRMGAFSIAGVSELRTSLTDTRSFVLNTYEINDQLIYNLGVHSFKVGGSIRRYQLNADSALARDGVFVYSGGLESFLTSTPQVLFVTLPGTDFYRGIRQSLFGFYGQDDWKVRSNLTLNLGLRYEPSSTPSEASGKVANLRNFTDAAPTVGGPYYANPSRKNFGPRLGFAWDPTGKGRTAVRGGAGIFYSAILPMRYRFMISNVPPFTQLVVMQGPFPNAFSTSAQASRPSGFLWITEFKAEQPTVYQWNLNAQHEVSKNMLITAGYVGSRGVNLLTGDSSNVRRDYQIVNGQKFFPAGTGQRINPNFAAVQQLGFNGDSYYHALQLSANRRQSAGLQFQVAYTLSKSLDTNSATDSVFSNGTFGADRQDPYNPAMDRARSDFDARHNLVANFMWDLPVGKGHPIGGNIGGNLGKLVNGWSMGGILNFKSGFPFGVVLGFDRARSGIDNPQSQRPDVAPNVELSNAVTGDPNRYVDPTFFRLQPAGFYGNAPRNSLTGPNLQVFDLALTKKTPLKERLQTEFRIETFNLFNRTNFAPLDYSRRVIYTGVNAGGNAVVPQSFGQLTRTATSARQIQLGFKLIW
ncbi:MAG TPA: TonB-dependent receptor [Blastocatellia bacterium]|nr:TonB-dependent receptor [Blastocatellia bacterium]